VLTETNQYIAREDSMKAYTYTTKVNDDKKTKIAAKRYDGNILREKLITKTTMCLRAQKTKCTVQWSP
jgi:hypothetical protein